MSGGEQAEISLRLQDLCMHGVQQCAFTVVMVCVCVCVRTF